MMITPSRFTRLCRNRAFSAIEVIAVATIIAILALILIPILTKEVGKSRETAAKDEMSNLAKVITLGYAETGHYFRLQDYDNTSTYFADQIADPTEEVPVTFFGVVGQMSAADRAKLKDVWDGPRTAFQRSATMLELYEDSPAALTVISAGSSTVLQAGGPIFVNVTGPLTLGEPVPEPPTLDERRDSYPLDPWGNPYLYFPSGAVVVLGVGSESVYSPVIYSMGPDGFPGSKMNPVGSDYYPPPLGVLGAESSDDLTWKF